MGRWLGSRQANLEIIETNGVRQLHLGGSAIQSALRLATPDRLELHYTRALLGVLLFHPAPHEMLLVGLGGGSIARFVHAFLPDVRLTAVELDARMPAVARAHFGLPPDDARLAVRVEEGFAHLAANPATYDVVLLDAFENNQPAASLCNPLAYAAARAALRANGVLAQNFMASAGQLETRLPALREAFDGRVLLMLTGDGANLIAFAFRDPPAEFLLPALQAEAVRLEPALQIGLGRTLQALEQMNTIVDDTLRCRVEA